MDKTVFCSVLPEVHQKKPSQQEQLDFSVGPMFAS
jgi:hypothetical protein